MNLKPDKNVLIPPYLYEMPNGVLPKQYKEKNENLMKEYHEDIEKNNLNKII